MTGNRIAPSEFEDDFDPLREAHEEGAYCESCEADRLWETQGIQPVWASPTHTCGEPLYDLRTKTWDKSCPCVEAMQTDPDCEWHGRIARCPQPSEPEPEGV